MMYSHKNYATTPRGGIADVVWGGSPAGRTLSAQFHMMEIASPKA